eukprot:GHVS01012184.1.p1 GENE.GHVS01012184.1~~GHVS01012184.1.p1  ORF type:complete len:248 (+),score=38.94 GHVS01012184.1:684-1427(+)
MHRLLISSALVTVGFSFPLCPFKQVSEGTGQDLCDAVKRELKLRVKGAATELNLDETVQHQHIGHVSGNGCGVELVAETDNKCLFYANADTDKRSRNVQEVAEQCVRYLCSQLAHGGCVDDHMQDQVIVPMSLAKGTSTVITGPLTLHTKTAIHVAQLLTSAKISVFPIDAALPLLTHIDDIQPIQHQHNIAPFCSLLLPPARCADTTASQEQQDRYMIVCEGIDFPDAGRTQATTTISTEAMIPVD